MERHSPRGRISLMRAIADKEMDLSKVFGEEMYYCLGCLACTSACPAGVDYAQLFETARFEIEEKGVLRSRKRDFIRWAVVRFLFTRPRMLHLMGRMLWIYQRSGVQWLLRRCGFMRLLPASLRRLEPQTPVVRSRFSHQLIEPVERTRDSEVRYKVAVLTGCVQDMLFSEINRATVDVLKHNGCEVHTPPLQSCCGSLHSHNGDVDSAVLLAKRAIDQIDPFAFDAIISNAGGCGSHLRAYDKLLAKDPDYATKAAEWSRKLKDVTEFLVEIDFERPQSDQESGNKRAITYHESCHLCHGQKVSRQPREVLKSIPGLELKEASESSWCCGSAGIYSITQPETSAWLLKRKLGHLRNTGAGTVAMANPGCHLHIQNGMHAAGDSTEIVHPVVLLAEAYKKAAESKAQKS